MKSSLIESLALLPESERTDILRSLSREEAEVLLWDWPTWARPDQIAPEGDWLVWLLKAGRGFGKSRSGAEWVRGRVASGLGRRIALVARNPADARDVMIEGQSGILAIAPSRDRPKYEPSKRRLTWPNGAMATIFTSYEPDQLRGPEFDTAWVDELRSFKYPQQTWDNLMLALRLGPRPQVCVTTTPSPIAVIRNLMRRRNEANPEGKAEIVVTEGSTYDNRANLPEVFYRQIVERYKGTTLGRQEIYGALLDRVPGALWEPAMFNERQQPRRKFNEKGEDIGPDVKRVVVAIDPATTSGEESDETGIVVAALGNDGRGYVLADRSCRVSPNEWAKRAVASYFQFRADRIIGEANNGGDMVELTIRTVDVEKSVSYKKVHASRGKQARAEPIAALYEQGKVSHAEEFPELEDQLCTWTSESGKSPDRLDALVWALTELMLGGGQWKVWL